jgi:calcineurin-like phosphoesterase family protein
MRSLQNYKSTIAHDTWSAEPYASGIKATAGSWHLYGHSHGRLPEVPDSLSMDVGVDTHEFRPWHYDEIAGVMRRRSEAREGAKNA